MKQKELLFAGAFWWSERKMNYHKTSKFSIEAESFARHDDELYPVTQGEMRSKLMWLTHN
jgi:hypothetical protein